MITTSGNKITKGYSSNKLLAFLHRRIPYIPELKKICGSVCASIIMQQLEYWFSNHPNGFYKFLEPCQHERYKYGDSWTEELNFTVREFRTGFDKIGYRYKSKKQFHAVVKQGDDPFQSKYYLSYIDVRSGQTVYQRNHLVVDELLNKLLQTYQPQREGIVIHPIDSKGNAEYAFPELTMTHFQKCQNSISRNADLTPYIKEQKTTNKEDTKITAADSPSQSITNDHDINAKVFTTAALNSNKISKSVINIIKDELTSCQREYVSSFIPELYKYQPNLSYQEFEKAMEFTLCNSEFFSLAGNDFLKKWNTLKKAIKNGNWQVPERFLNSRLTDFQRKRNALQIQKNELQSEISHLEGAANHFLTKADYEQQRMIEIQIDGVKEKLYEIEEKLIQLGAQ